MRRLEQEHRRCAFFSCSPVWLFLFCSFFFSSLSPNPCCVPACPPFFFLFLVPSHISLPNVFNPCGVALRCVQSGKETAYQVRTPGCPQRVLSSSFLLFLFFFCCLSCPPFFAFRLIFPLPAVSSGRSVSGGRPCARNSSCWARMCVPTRFARGFVFSQSFALIWSSRLLHAHCLLLPFPMAAWLV